MRPDPGAGRRGSHMLRARSSVEERGHEIRARETPRPVGVEELRSASLFRGLEDGLLADLAARFVELEVPPDGVVYRGGEPSDFFYVVTEGELVVFRDLVGKPLQLLGHLAAGDFFGELALLANAPHGSAVRARSPSRVLRLAKGDLLDFLDRQPDVRLRLQNAAAQRHSSNVAAALELGRRREVRIRFRHEVEISLAGDRGPETVLENLSLGGLSLSGAPAGWQTGEQVSFGLGLREGRLDLVGRIVWRHGETVGIAFDKRSPNHDTILQMTIRSLIEAAQ